MDKPVKKKVNKHLNKNLSTEYRLIGSQILSLRFDFVDSLVKKNYKHDFTYEFTMVFGAIKENREVNMINQIKIFLDKDKKELVGLFDTLNTFEISNFDDIVKFENESIKIPTNILAIFFGISFSNSRGMLLSKSAGTCLQNAILPVINPLEFLEQAEKINEEKSK